LVQCATVGECATKFLLYRHEEAWDQGKRSEPQGNDGFESFFAERKLTHLKEDVRRKT
jgi:hypothetical protein